MRDGRFGLLSLIVSNDKFEPIKNRRRHLVQLILQLGYRGSLGPARRYDGIEASDVDPAQAARHLILDAEMRQVVPAMLKWRIGQKSP
jgi:hypothetical protein